MFWTKKLSDADRIERLAVAVVLGGMKLAQDSTTMLADEDRVSIDSRRADEFVVEIIAICLHVVDRLLFQNLGALRRSGIMDGLLPKVLEVIRQTVSDRHHATICSTRLVDIYDARQVEYSGYPRLFAEKDEGLRGTLFWEFAKRMATLADPDRSDLALYLHIHFSSSLVALLTEPEVARLLKE